MQGSGDHETRSSQVGGGMPRGRQSHGCTHWLVQYVYTCSMRDEKEEEASKVKQTTRQSNTAHPRQSLFLRKISRLVWDSNPRHSTL